MARGESASMPGKMPSSDALMRVRELRQRLDAFGSRLRQLKEQEPVGPSREWLEEAERRYQNLDAALEDYSRERAAQRPDESACERAGRKVQECYQGCDNCLREPTRTGARKVAEDIRKSWNGVSNAFDRALGVDEGLRSRLWPRASERRS